MTEIRTHTKRLENIFSKFDLDQKIDSITEIKSGHINDTFLIKTFQKPFYVLQRVNHEVFKQVTELIENKVLVSEHLRKKRELKISKFDQQVLCFIQTREGAYYHQEESGNFWNLMVYVDNSKTFEIVPDENVAYEAGKLFGEFLDLTNDLDASELNIVIPGFHDMSVRYTQFEEAVNNASIERRTIAKTYIKRVYRSKEDMLVLQTLKEAGKIKERVTHNDTKISNALFNMENKAICVIDTDTVMPGIVHYDFGDALRTICNTGAEDEPDLSKVAFNWSFYEAYKKGFLEKSGNSLSPTEIDLLPHAVKTMIFIIALRFLTDYLNGNIYFKVAYPEHNLIRAKNQFKLLDSFEEKRLDHMS